jgi:hypothetical protein
MEPKVFVEAEKSLKKKRIENAINFKIPASSHSANQTS